MIYNINRKLFTNYEMKLNKIICYDCQFLETTWKYVYWELLSLESGKLYINCIFTLFTFTRSLEWIKPLQSTPIKYRWHDHIPY